MQILQWLFKLAKEEACSTSPHESTVIITNSRAYLKDISGKKTSKGSKDRQRKRFRRFRWRFCRRKVEEACFYGTLSLVGSESRRRRWEDLIRSIEKMKEEEVQVVSRRFDSNNIKVLPITEATSLNLEGNSKEKVKNEQTKARATISRMKELIRWAAAAKSDKAAKFISPKILEFRKRSMARRRQEKDENRKAMSDESPKMSFRCSNLSSIYTEVSTLSSPKLAVSVGTTPQYHFGYRRGNWITTDSEFVVLEL